MPPVVFLAVIGAGCYAGYKLFSNLMIQARTPPKSETERLRREAEARASRTRDLGALELDENTGVYKPKSSA